MCEMEISPKFETDEILQAMAHNTSTIDRDCDMVRELLKARKQHNALFALEVFQGLIHRAYALMLEEYGIAVAEVTMDQKGHVHLVGNEKTSIMAEIRRSTEEAHKYETR